MASQFPGSPIPKSVPVKLRDRVMYWDDERNEGNSLIVTLRAGWRWLDDPWVPNHTFGADTVREAVERLRYTGPCDCPQCVKDSQ